MKRVVHLSTVHRALDPRIFRKEARSLHQAGFDVHLIARHPQDEELDGIPVHALPAAAGRVGRLPLHRLAFRKVKALQPDAIHFHDPELIPLAFMLRRSTGARVVYDMHEDYRTRAVVGGGLRVLERWCFGWVDAVVVAEEPYVEIVEPYGVPCVPVLNYFQPVDDEERPLAPVEAFLTLIYTGTQARARGLDAMIDLGYLIHTHDLPCRIKLVGICYRAADREWADTQIAERGLESVIQRIGWNRYVPWPDMVPHYASANVGLALFPDHPDYRQKVLTKFYEYLNFELPILCSDFPRWQQFIDRHRCGATVPPGDATAAFEILKTWIEQPQHCATLSDAARAVAPLYRWEVMEERLLELYRELLP